MRRWLASYTAYFKARDTPSLWHELKEFIRREVKPKNKAELVEGIKRFWLTVDATKCQKYIQYLSKVIPRIVELNGNATGY